jgi:hypothetical protein
MTSTERLTSSGAIVVTIAFCSIVNNLFLAVGTGFDYSLLSGSW